MKPFSDDQLCRNSIYVSLLSIATCVLLLFGEHSYWEYYTAELDRDSEIVIFALSIVFLVLASVASLFVFIDGVIRIAKKQSLKTVFPLTLVEFFQFFFLMMNAHAVSYMGYILTSNDLGYFADRFSNGTPKEGITITLAVFAVLTIILACVFLSLLKNGTMPDALSPVKLAESAKKSAAQYNASLNQTSTAFCPYCGSELTDSAKFCPHCGKDVTAFQKEASALFCPGCGKPLKTYSAFCPNCGCDLSPLKEEFESVKNNVVKEEETEKQDAE